jgi:hypothetical protein
MSMGLPYISHYLGPASIFYGGGTVTLLGTLFQYIAIKETAHLTDK